MTRVDAIADAVLYEGYLLWPYRRSALKNRQRWTFGGVFPEAWAAAAGTGDRGGVETEWLVEAGARATMDVGVRFLHVVARGVERRDGGRREPVDELCVDGVTHVAWDEATEREVTAERLPIAALVADAVRVPIVVAAGSEEEPLGTPTAGALVRSWRRLDGVVEVRAERRGDRLYRVRVAVANTSASVGATRADAQRQAFLSLHVMARVRDGAFVSATDPPATLGEEAAACRNEGLWPVLVGEEGARDTLLAAPIVLPDWPQVAPESPGDLFDATEIDQMLVLNVLALTDAEREEMRAADPRARAILERCTSLAREDVMRLHGAVRSLRPLAGREP